MSMDDNTAWVLTFAAILLIVAVVALGRAWRSHSEDKYEPDRLRAKAELVHAENERRRLKSGRQAHE